MFFTFRFSAISICASKSLQWGFWVENVVCLCLGRQNALLCIFISLGISLCTPSYRTGAAEVDAHSSMFVSRTAVTDTLWLAPCRSSGGLIYGRHRMRVCASWAGKCLFLPRPSPRLGSAQTQQESLLGNTTRKCYTIKSAINCHKKVLT